MKVLIVSDLCTHPHKAGNSQELYRVCCQMKKLGWELDFLYWGNRLTPDYEAMEQFLGEKHIFYANISSVSLKHELRAHVRKRLNKKGITKYVALPYAVDEYYYSEVEEKVKFLHKRKNYDVIWLEYYLQSKVLCGLDNNIIKVIHTHDRFADRHKMFQKVRRIPEFYYLTQKGERKALSRADVVIAIQEKEQKYFEELLKGTDTKSITIGNLVQMNTSQCPQKKRYGFLAAVNDNNCFALEWFIEKVLPRIRETEPTSEFVIAGGICKVIPDSEAYVKLGFVETLNEFYDNVKFVVSPILNGTGLNIKNIEALAYRKALVTTGIGAKGLEGAEDALLLCDGENDFAKAVVGLLNDENRRVSMEKCTEKFIAQYNEKNINALKSIEDIVLDRRNRK